MAGIIAGYVVAVVLGALGFLMLRFPDWWVEFFRQGRTELGRRVNRHLVSRSTVLAQAVLVSLFALFLLVMMTSSLIATVA